MDFNEYFQKQFTLTGKIEAYLEVKEIQKSGALIYLLDQMIRNTFGEKELLKMEYDNQKLESTFLEHNER